MAWAKEVIFAKSSDVRRIQNWQRKQERKKNELDRLRLKDKTTAASADPKDIRGKN